jgi:tRNA G18 (ribose-2'-O)-methylase SpoU
MGPWSIGSLQPVCRYVMSVIEIASGDDPRLADYIGVREPGRFTERGLLCAEGRFVVRRLLEQRRLVFQSFLLNQAALESLHDDIERYAPEADVFLIASSGFAAATGFSIHRGCLALAERPAAMAMEDLTSSSQLVVALERIADADNVGGIFRNAEAFGVDAVVLGPGCSDPFYRKAIRTSSGATCVVPHVPVDSWPDALDQLRAAGFLLVATTPSAHAVSISEFARSGQAAGRVAVLIGNEGHGLSEESLTVADVRVRIPMTGRSRTMLDSLNVATAAGIVLQRISEVR